MEVRTNQAGGHVHTFYGNDDFFGHFMHTLGNKAPCEASEEP